MNRKFWTDTQGAAFPFGGIFQSLDANEMRTALVNLDLLAEKLMGQNWVVTSDAASFGIARGICYPVGQGSMVMVGDNGSGAPAIRTSPDGNAWTAPTVAAGSANAALATATSGSGVVVAVNETSNPIRESSDLTTWNSRAFTPAPSVQPEFVFYDSTNGLYITTEVGRGSATSSNRTTWTYVALALPAAFAGVGCYRGAHGNGVNIIVGDTVGYCARSTNGTTWSAVALPASSAWKDVCYAPSLGKWFATRNGFTSFAYSTDNGASWSLQGFNTYPANEVLWYIASSGNILVAVSTSYRILVSQDEGLTWYTVGRSVLANYDVAYLPDDSSGIVGGRFVVIGEDPHATVGLRVST